MAYAIVRLMNEGLTGPSAGIEYSRESDAIDWANGQTGHPWDIVTVEVYEDQEDSQSGGDPSTVLTIDLATTIATYE